MFFNTEAEMRDGIAGQLEEFKKATVMNLSGNSHGEEACAYLANEVIAKLANEHLHTLDFSDMFT